MKCIFICLVASCILFFTPSALLSQTSEDSLESYQLVCMDGIDNDGDGLIDCEDPDCIENGVLSCLPCFNNPFAYADSVELYTETCTAGNNLYTNPSDILGQPNANNVYPGASVLSLGHEGSVRLRFTDNLIANSGDFTPDIGVFEVGASREGVRIDLRPYDAFTKLMMQYSRATDPDGDGFFYFGETDGGIDFFDIDSLFTRNFEANRLLFDGLLLTDLPESSCNGTSPGADIDAVCGAGILREICGNNSDDDNDGLIDDEDPECGCERKDNIRISVSGSVCREGVSLMVNPIPGATYQWFKDGQPVSGATDYILDGLVNTRGFFEVAIDDGETCLFSEQVAFDIPFYEAYVEQKVCPGDSFPFLGAVHSDTGVYIYSLTAEQDGCDSTVYLNFEVVDYGITEINRTICKGDSLFFFGETLRDEGTYSKVLTSALGCDSTVVLTLQLENILSDTFALDICIGDNIIFRGDTIDSAGEYVYQFNIPGVCDSVQVLQVTESLTIQKDTSIYLCDGDSVFYIDRYYSEAGQYQVFEVNGDTCLSYSLQLFLQERTVIDTLFQLCPGRVIFFGNEVYFKPGQFTQILEGQDACDTILNVEVISIPNSSGSVELFFCEGEQVHINGETFSDPGIYTQFLESSLGCDSILNVSLIQIDTNVIRRNYRLCPGESVMIADSLLMEPGQYSFSFENGDGCLDSYNIRIEHREDCEQCISSDQVFNVGRLEIHHLEGGYFRFMVTRTGRAEQEYLLDLKELAYFITAYVLDEYSVLGKKAMFQSDYFWKKARLHAKGTTEDQSFRKLWLSNIEPRFSTTEIFVIKKMIEDIRQEVSKLRPGNRYSKESL